MQKLRVGDEVVVIAGRSKADTGKILQRLADGRLLVSGVNIVKKHQKANPMAGQAGGIIEKEAPIHASNVMLLNKETNKGDRVMIGEDNGRKVRKFKSTGATVPNPE